MTLDSHWGPPVDPLLREGSLGLGPSSGVVSRGCGWHTDENQGLGRVPWSVDVTLRVRYLFSRTQVTPHRTGRVSSVSVVA